jgi:ribosome-interacting GTPase 1
MTVVCEPEDLVVLTRIGAMDEHDALLVLRRVWEDGLEKAKKNPGQDGNPTQAQIERMEARIAKVKRELPEAEARAWKEDKYKLRHNRRRAEIASVGGPDIGPFRTKCLVKSRTN